MNYPKNNYLKTLHKKPLDNIFYIEYRMIIMYDLLIFNQAKSEG